MYYSTALRVSLKEMQVTMMYKNVQEFNADWQLPLAEQEIDEIVLDFTKMARKAKTLAAEAFKKQDVKSALRKRMAKPIHLVLYCVLT